MLDRALALGFDAVVTGHHARLDDGVLRRSVDLAKDQSYVLAVLRPDQLAAHRAAARRLDQGAGARRGGRPRPRPSPTSRTRTTSASSPTATPPGFLRARLGEQPGPVVDALTGAVVGRHAGAYGFTVGQRRGLDLRVPAPDGRPRYVLSVEPVDAAP